MPAPSARREVSRIGRGLEVRAAKRKDKERSLVLTVTLAVEEGNEEKVQALCRGIVEHFRPMVSGAIFAVCFLNNLGLPDAQTCPEALVVVW